jgi:hypothetical protein
MKVAMGREGQVPRDAGTVFQRDLRRAGIPVQELPMGGTLAGAWTVSTLTGRSA